MKNMEERTRRDLEEMLAVIERLIPRQLEPATQRQLGATLADFFGFCADFMAAVEDPGFRLMVQNYRRRGWNLVADFELYQNRYYRPVQALDLQEITAASTKH